LFEGKSADSTFFFVTFWADDRLCKVADITNFSPSGWLHIRFYVRERIPLQPIVHERQPPALWPCRFSLRYQCPAMLLVGVWSPIRVSGLKLFQPLDWLLAFGSMTYQMIVMRLLRM